MSKMAGFEGNLTVRRPRRPDAAVIVGAHNDAYVSAHSVRELAAHWPGSQVGASSICVTLPR